MNVGLDESTPPDEVNSMEAIINAVTSNRMREWTDKRVMQAMQEYSNSQNKKLRDVLEQVRCGYDTSEYIYDLITEALKQ